MQCTCRRVVVFVFEQVCLLCKLNYRIFSFCFSESAWGSQAQKWQCQYC